MKTLKCEMCGSVDLVKQDGLFVCQYCGTKYSLEEARKMMIEGTVEVQGTVKVDSSDKVENLLLRAKQFEQDGQLDKALEYFNKVLDINANDKMAVTGLEITKLLIQAKLFEEECEFKKALKCYNMILDIDGGYKVAQEGVERLEGKDDRFYIGEVVISYGQMAEIEKLVINQEKIAAIKLVKDISGLGLADAKTWVENYRNYNLHEKQYFSSQQNGSFSKLSTSDEGGKANGCYVATCVYGSYDCPQVWTLRRYRDDTLGSTWYGRAFIRTYYAISPTLVKWFGETNWFKKMWKGKLDRIVKKLQDKGVENTPYKDKDWRK